MERITDFTETLAPMDRGDAQGDIYTAEKNLLDIIDDLRLSTVQHNALMGAIDRYRNLCEECARAFAV